MLNEQDNITSQKLLMLLYQQQLISEYIPLSIYSFPGGRSEITNII